MYMYMCITYTFKGFYINTVPSWCCSDGMITTQHRLLACVCFINAPSKEIVQCR